MMIEEKGCMSAVLESLVVILDLVGWNEESKLQCNQDRKFVTNYLLTAQFPHVCYLLDYTHTHTHNSKL